MRFEPGPEPDLVLPDDSSSLEVEETNRARADLEPAPVLPVTYEAAAALTALRQAIAGADEQREALAAAGDIDSLAIGLVGFRMLVRDLRTLADATEDDLERIMGEQGERSISIDYVGTFERKRSTSRTGWQTEDLARRIVRDALERGEINHPDDVVSLLLLHASISGFRVTPLRDAGYEPADWCVEDVDGYSIKHTPPGGAAK